MKRILVVDDSEAVRETLALILGREFVILQRPLGRQGFSFTDADREVDLLIFGLSPEFGVESSTLLTMASQVPFAVLFLVDSKSEITSVAEEWQVDCLAKPFNPYELREKVGRLLSQQRRPVRPSGLLSSKSAAEFMRYLEFPFLPRSVALLARKFAATDLPVHVYGEIGCGQEQVARAIYACNGKGGLWIPLHACEISQTNVGQRIVQSFRDAHRTTQPFTLFLDGLETLSPQGQSSLLQFLDGGQEHGGKPWLITTSRADLLERVYRGEFLEPLYYKLAVLILRLPPLRERQQDLPLLADWLAAQYAQRLNLGRVSITSEAGERLRKYLWFGNVHEMEAVVARTLATHQKGVIEASDWVFGMAAEGHFSLPPQSGEPPTEQEAAVEAPSVSPTSTEEEIPAVGGPSNGKAPDLKILIHELAHELKNPMVTIKTFAQLLGDRYQDETFRARFQDIVGHDIERIDDLLEIMIEFADFSQPTLTRILFRKELRSVLEDIAAECAKREVQIHWKGEQKNGHILADEAQLKYALRNVLLSVLSQMKAKSEIEIDMGEEGCVSISYVREGGRVTPLTHYLNFASEKEREAILPLRILLAKQLVERNGGEVVIDSLEGDRELLRLEFPVA